ncbi:hypothetical protein QJQ45_010850 [Haematococcus lacustris]|nr:hypothetical protein QJQ45_010850 [Haematococcus lacustris]
MVKHRNVQRLTGLVETINQPYCKSPARTQKYKLLCHSLGLKASAGIRSLLTDLPTLLAAYGLLLILRSLNRPSLLCQSRAIFVEDLMQEVALTTDIPPRGRRAALVPASDFQRHVDGAKQELAATAVAAVHDLRSRFLQPEHAEGPAIVYCHYWDKQPSDEDFLERQTIDKARHCMEGTLANDQRVPALLDQHKLSAQQSAVVDVMRSQAGHRIEFSSAAANPAEPTIKLWAISFSQYIGPWNCDQVSCVLHLLRLGRPMTDLEATQELLTTTKHLAVAKAHWKDNAGWQMDEAIDAVYQGLTMIF